MNDICKVILIGESGVGKTCIIVRFVNESFYFDSSSTNGAAFATKTLEFPDYKKSLKYNIWDTAGQEKYRSLAKIFYKDAVIGILVYDICNKNSFENIKNYWYEQIKENSSANISKIFLFKFIFYNKVFGLAGNKKDKFLEEQVSNKEGEEFARKIGAYFKLTSAKTNDGILDLFKELGRRYLDPNYRLLREKEDKEEVIKNKERSKSVKLKETKIENKVKKWYLC